MPRAGKIVGLDIGLHSVKAVWAERKATGTACTRAEALPLPQDGTDPSVVMGPWLQQMGLVGASCVIGVPGDQCMFQPMLMAPQ